jgi:hypothetical protein
VASARAAGHALLDLTESNPTHVGLSEWTPELQAMLAHARAQRYEPDPRGDLAAREAIARYHGERGAAPSPDSVVLTSGTSESYAHLFRLLADPDDVVLVPRPSYPLFEPIADLEAVRLESYRLAWDGAWHLDLGSVDAALAAAGERARALILVEPNHPTGTTLDESEREALGQRLATRGIALISDEVFADFPWPPRHDPLPGWLGERRVPTFVLGGLSKCCGLPQLKLGWIWVGGPAVERDRSLAALEWIADLFLSVASPVQLALPKLLERRIHFWDGTLSRLQGNRDRLTTSIDRRPGLSILAANGGWVACLRLPATRTEDEWTLALLERGVIVHPGHFYDFGFGPLAVISLIIPPRDFSLGLERLEALLAGS